LVAATAPWAASATLPGLLTAGSDVWVFGAGSGGGATSAFGRRNSM
jgi:hypothetical protein